MRILSLAGRRLAASIPTLILILVGVFLLLLVGVADTASAQIAPQQPQRPQQPAPVGEFGQWVTSGTYELEVATGRVPAEVSLKPLYDPTNARVKA